MAVTWRADTLEARPPLDPSSLSSAWARYQILRESGVEDSS
jgi:hypothetical protein